MSAIDSWDAPRWADFYASPMANIDDYFNTEHSELERRHTTGKDSLCGSILENLQEISPPDNCPEAKGANNNTTLPETNNEVVPLEAAPHKADLPEPVQEKTIKKKIVKTNQSRPKVLTSNVRRQSIARHRRRSDQYVPLAEALRKFQNGTPMRFRSNKVKDNNEASLKNVKQTKSQLTCPMSPALRCKLRTRSVSTAREKMQPAAKPVPKSTSFPRAFPSALQKKSTTEKPLKKIDKIPPALSSESKTTMLPPKVSAIVKEIDKTLTVPSSSKDESSLSSSIMSKSMRTHKTPRKQMAPTVVSTDEGMTIKEVEVLHFGIPIANATKKITRPKPFSFETRTTELQNKKVKLKNQQEEAEKMKKPTFHAKNAPSTNIAKKTLSVLKPAENNVKTNQTVRTFTFKERNEIALKKKKELMDEMYEKEKKARVFRAKPAPTFKPVFVRGNSTENLRAGDKNKAKIRGISPTAAIPKAQNQESHGSGNQENEAPSVANQGCPKLKIPLVTDKQKLKRTTK